MSVENIFCDIIDKYTVDIEELLKLSAPSLETLKDTLTKIEDKDNRVYEYLASLEVGELDYNPPEKWNSSTKNTLYSFIEYMKANYGYEDKHTGIYSSGGMLKEDFMYIPKGKCIKIEITNTNVYNLYWINENIEKLTEDAFYYSNLNLYLFQQLGFQVNSIKVKLDAILEI